jgi:dTDP-glucose 4,6-dehydratase
VKVLVTGASGFIGHNVLLRAPREWQIVALYNHTPGLEEFVRRHQLDGVRAVRCDLTDAAAVGEFARADGSFDACLYLAANGDPARSAERPAWDLQLNTLALVTCLEHIRFGHVVYVSSGAVYDGLSGAVTPATPVAPRLPYAISKLASEHYLRAFAERPRTVGSFVNVRFFGAYGPYEPHRKITTRWLRGLMSGQREFAVRGNGENLIDFMYVDDAVDGFLALTTSSGCIRLTRDRQRGRADDGAGPRRTRHDPPRGAHRGIHSVPLRRHHHARSVRDRPGGEFRRRRAAASRLSDEATGWQPSTRVS